MSKLVKPAPAKKSKTPSMLYDPVRAQIEALATLRSKCPKGSQVEVKSLKVDKPPNSRDTTWLHEVMVTVAGEAVSKTIAHAFYGRPGPRGGVMVRDTQERPRGAVDWVVEELSRRLHGDIGFVEIDTAQQLRRQERARREAGVTPESLMEAVRKPAKKWGDPAG